MNNPAVRIEAAIDRHAAARPKATALVDGDRSLSYGDLAKYSDGFAALLQKAELPKLGRVALLSAKSLEIFVAMYGTAKSGGVYVPLDPRAPKARLAKVLKSCDCSVLCFEEKLRPLAEELATEANCQFQELVMTQPPSGWERPQAGPSNDPLYILYTSGSTGEPKGVTIPHQAVLDYGRWCVQHFQVKPEDRLSNHAQLYFDLSVFDVYTALEAGATLCLVPPMVSMFPVKFFEFMESQKISVWCSVPSFLTRIAKSGLLGDFQLDSLRAVTFCGEVMPTSTMMAWMEAHPGVRFVNQYGPTETTCASMYYDIAKRPSDATVPIPIGRAIPNTEVFAITDGRRSQAGEVGELYIRGVGNSLGYWRDAERSARAFVQSPLHSDYTDLVYATGDLVRLREDGDYDFVGRQDSQVQHRGYRVELGEIESLLTGLEQVNLAAALARKDESGEVTELVAFVSGRDDMDAAAIRSFLKERLPHYMVPGKLVILPDLPQNANGKIDRKELLSRVEG